jgi:hypothetical protein
VTGTFIFPLFFVMVDLIDSAQRGSGLSALPTSAAGITEVGAQFEREGLNEWPPLELNE